MNPDEAITKYNKVEEAACNEYRDYWIAKFNAVGITLVADSWRGLSGQFQNYKLDAYVNPARYNGIRITIQGVPSTYWQNVKVKSDSGFVKLIRKLQRGAFV